MLKAIETVYRGYRFRSRLEARWAVFFDTLGVRWEYEKEGYDLGPAGWYLPDFWLPDFKCWIEIKASKPTNEECTKAAALAEASTSCVYIFDHPDFEPPSLPLDDGKFTGAWARKFWPERYDDEGDFGFEWFKCIHCSALGVGDNVRHASSCVVLAGPKVHGWAHGSHADLRTAYLAARQARFEHGEHS